MSQYAHPRRKPFRSHATSMLCIDDAVAGLRVRRKTKRVQEARAGVLGRRLTCTCVSCILTGSVPNQATVEGRPQPPPLGALIFSCNGRGLNLYGEPNYDSATLASFVPVPASGMFCNGARALGEALSADEEETLHEAQPSRADLTAHYPPLISPRMSDKLWSARGMPEWVHAWAILSNKRAALRCVCAAQGRSGRLASRPTCTASLLRWASSGSSWKQMNDGPLATRFGWTDCKKGCLRDINAIRLFPITNSVYFPTDGTSQWLSAVTNAAYSRAPQLGLGARAKKHCAACATCSSASASAAMSAPVGVADPLRSGAKPALTADTGSGSRALPAAQHALHVSSCGKFRQACCTRLAHLLQCRRRLALKIRSALAPCGR